MRQTGYRFGGDYCGYGDGRGSGSDGGSGGVSCQDCGNQAKKDCQHMRCRTCCRSRGLPCETHVKSTWVPAAKRRERRQQQSLSPQQQNSGNQQLSLMIASGGGRVPGHNPGGFQEDQQHRGVDQQHRGVAVPGTDFHNTSSELGFHYPAELISPALFRRVRVSGMNETNEQLAYQTAISVGGHVFNGILYDHGPDRSQHNHPGESSSAAPNQHQDANLVASRTSTAIDPSSMYPTHCHFISGTQFFPPPRS